MQFKETTTREEALAGLDLLHNAARYLASQFRTDLLPEDAKTHFQARNALKSCQQMIFHEHYADFLGIRL